MECADCETSLDDFMVDQYELGRLDLSLCFSCYLARDETAFDYSDYELSGRFGNHNDVVKTALSQNNEFKIELLIEGYESQGIVLFASTRSDADSLLSTIANSELGDYISQTALLPLREVYSEGPVETLLESLDRPQSDILLCVPPEKATNHQCGQIRDKQPRRTTLHYDQIQENKSDNGTPADIRQKLATLGLCFQLQTRIEPHGNRHECQYYCREKRE